MVKEKLFKHFSGRIASPSGGPARMVRWFNETGWVHRIVVE